MTIFFTRLEATLTECMDIEAFTVVPNPEHNNVNWIVVNKQFLCPLNNLHHCYSK